MNAMDCIQPDQIGNDVFRFIPTACSAYARNVAKDFNPIHSHLAKKYCVPGDLIFALITEMHGAHNYMRVDFLNRVGAECKLFFDTKRIALALLDVDKKLYAELATAGDKSVCPKRLKTVSNVVVSCTSGYFPYKLIDNLREENVMLSIRRSMVMLKSIEVELRNIHSASSLVAKYQSSGLELSGKRGEVKVYFQLFDDDGISVGFVTKTVLIIGIEKFNDKASKQYLDDYEGIVQSPRKNTQFEASPI